LGLVICVATSAILTSLLSGYRLTQAAMPDATLGYYGETNASIQIPVPPPTGTLLDTVEIARTFSVDSDRFHNVGGSAPNLHAYQVYRFDNIPSATTITVYHTGYNANITHLRIYDFSGGSWYELASHSYQTDTTISGSVTSTNYRNSYGQVYVGVYGNGTPPSSPAALYTNYVYINTGATGLVDHNDHNGLAGWYYSGANTPNPETDTDMGTQLNSAQLTKCRTSDDDHYSTVAGAGAGGAWHIFRFDSVNNASVALIPFWEGYGHNLAMGNGYNMTLKIWNFSSNSWTDADTGGRTSAVSVDDLRTNNLTSGVSDHVSSGQTYVAVYFVIHAVEGATINTDRIYLQTIGYNAPTLITQAHYRFRDDTTALNTSGGWLAAEDTGITVAKDTVTRLRLSIGKSADDIDYSQYKWQWKKDAGSWTDLAATGDVKWTLSSQYANNDNTTTRLLTSPGGTLTNGEAIENANTTERVNMPTAARYTELEMAWKFDAAAASGSTYSFRVIKAGPLLSDDYELTNYDEIPTATPGGVTPPADPTNAYIDPSSSGVSTSKLTIKWTDNSDNESGFKVQQQTNCTGSFSTVYTTAAGATSYARTGLSANTSYCFRIYATNAAGDSVNPTNTARGQTWASRLEPSATLESAITLRLRGTNAGGSTTNGPIADKAAGSTAATFTRNDSDATYIADDGTLQNVQNANNARIERATASENSRAPGGGVRIEEARTNLVLNSSFENRTGNDFTSWTESVAGSTTITAETSDVLHSSTAVKINVVGGSGYGMRSPSIAIAASTTYTLSFYAKSSVDGKQFSVGILDNLGNYLQDDLVTWSASSNIIATGVLTSSWERKTLTFTTEAGAASFTRVDLFRYNSGDYSLLLDAVQLEAGAFATSYIPTTTGTATRNAETLTYVGASNLNTSAFTVSTWFKSDVFGITTGASSNRVFELYYNTNNFLRAYHQTSVKRVYVEGKTSGTGFARQCSSDLTNPTGWHQIAVTFTANGSMTYYLDGTSCGTVSGTTTFAVVPTIILGTNSVGTQTLNGLLSDFTIFNTALSAETIQGLYNGYGPSNVRITTPPTVDQALTVTYQDNSSNEDSGFNVQYQETGFSWTDSGTESENDTSHTKSGLHVNKQYTFRVRGNSGTYYSEYQEAQNPLGTSQAVYTLIETPAGISVNDVATNSLTVSSSTSLSNLTGGSSGVYFTENTGDPGGGGQACFGWTQTNSCQDTGLSLNTQYGYKVKARNGDAVETSETAVTNRYTLATAPGLPTVQVPVDVGDFDTLNIIVNKNGNPEAGDWSGADDTDYALYNDDLAKWVGVDGIADEDSPVWQTYSSWGGGSGQGNDNLLTDTQYTYSLRARNGDDVATSDSGSSDLYTRAEQPGYTTLAAHSGSTTSIDLEVDKNSNPTGEVGDPGLQNDTEYAIYNQTLGNWLGIDGVADEPAEVWANYTNWGGAGGLTNPSLSTNTQYTYQIKARNGDNNETNPSSDSKYTNIEIPTSVDFDDIQIGSLTISADTDFSNLGDGSSRVVYDFTSSPTGGGGGTDSGDYHANSYQDSGLDANDQYCYQVRAYNGDNVSSTSEAKPAVPACKYTWALPPNGESAAGNYTESNGYLTAVGWGLNGATEVRVHRVAPAEDIYEGAGTSKDDTLLNPNTTYDYQLYSLNGDDAVNPSPVTVSDTTPPDKPINLSATDITTNTVKNLWDAVADADTYEICYGQNPDGSDLTDCTSGINTESYDKAGLTSGTTYYYRVNATNGNGTGAWSHGGGVWSTPAPPYLFFTTSSANKLLVKLPGQTFTNGVGITGIATNQTAGNAFNFTVYAVDLNNWLDAGKTGAVSISSSDAQADLPANANLVAGTKQFTITLKTAGSQSVRASYLPGGVSDGVQLVTVLVGPASDAQSYITVDPSTLSVDQSSKVTVGIRDAYNNAISGKKITISTDHSDQVSYDSGQITNSSGEVVAYVTSSTAHTSAVTAVNNTDGNHTLPLHPTIAWTEEDQDLRAQIDGPNRAIVSNKVTFSGERSSGNITSYYWRYSDVYYDKNAPIFTSTGQTKATTSTYQNGAAVTVKGIEIAQAANAQTQSARELGVPETTTAATTSTQELQKEAKALTAQQKNPVVRTVNFIAEKAKGLFKKVSSWFSGFLSNTNEPTSAIINKVFAQDTGSRTERSFSGTGYYDVSLQITDTKGRTDSAVHQVLIIPPAPVITNIQRQGDKIVISGSAWPDVNVELFFSPSLESGASGRTRSSLAGLWTYSAPADQFKVGEYLVYGIAIDDHEINSDPSNEVKFRIDINGDVVIITPLPEESWWAKVMRVIRKLSVALSIAAIAGGAASLVLGLNFFNILPYLYYLFTMLMEKLGLIKKREPWGIIYDSSSKAPVELAIVRIFDVKNKKLLETRVTGKDGKFGFLVPPGAYKITITKYGYHFASEVVKPGAKSDDIYSNIYHGAAFAITPEKRFANYNIPIDPISAEKEEKPSIWHKIWVALLISRVYIKKFIIPLLVFAIILALATYVTLGERVDLLVAGIMAILLAWEIYNRRHTRTWGIVYDSKSKEPISGAVVKIFDEEYHKLKESRATDKEGRFGFIVPPGKYSIEVEKKDYRFPSTHIRHKNDGKYHYLYHGEIISKKPKDSVISMDIPLDLEE
jgi:hypothetical protein